MPRLPETPVIRPGDILISATGGGAGFAVQRVLDARRASWAIWHVGFARTEPEAVAMARKARAEATIWVQNDPHQRRARRLREEFP